MIALSSGGPAIRAKAIWTADRSSKAAAPQLLNNQQRAELSTIGSIVRFKKGQQIYRTGDPIDAIVSKLQRHLQRDAELEFHVIWGGLR